MREPRDSAAHCSLRVTPEATASENNMTGEAASYAGRRGLPRVYERREQRERLVKRLIVKDFFCRSSLRFRPPWGGLIIREVGGSARSYISIASLFRASMTSYTGV
jgi:hypothetical protein